MFTFFKGSQKADFNHFYELLSEMTMRELRARYKNTAFGFLWIILNPLLQMLIIGFVFQFFIKQPVPNYYYFLIIGLLAWNFFSVSLSKATPSIVNERYLIKKSKFPRSVIPLSIVLSNLIHFLIALVLIALPVLFLKTMTFFGIIYILLAVVLLFLFTTGLSLLSTALNVRYRDVSFFIQAFIMFWFYATPIIYPLSVVPYKYYWLWRFNPLTTILQYFQKGFLDMPLPGIAMVSMNITITIIILVLGIYLFRKESKNFDDWV